MSLACLELFIFDDIVVLMMDGENADGMKRFLVRDVSVFCFVF
jgi:hypothetical protein